METIASWAFVLGPIGGVVVLPVAWVMVNRSAWSPCRKSAMTALVALSVLLVLGHWAVWWFSFDYYRGESYPNNLFGLSTVLMYAASLTCLSAVTAAGTAWFNSRASATSVS